MGAPKQKWSAGEEAALKAGILKHGSGKWRQILKDPEFSSDLSLRSNVDLKDKWRNIHTPRSSLAADRPNTLNRPYAPELSRAGSGHMKSQPNVKLEAIPFALSRAVQSDDDIPDAKPTTVADDVILDARSGHKTIQLNVKPEATVALSREVQSDDGIPDAEPIAVADDDILDARSGHKKIQPNVKPEENTVALSMAVQSDYGILDANLIAVADENLSAPGSKISILRLDSLITEAIANLKERNGSNRTSIATYIEDHYDAPPNFKRILSAKLKLLLASGKLIKVKRNYRIAPDSGSSERSNMPEMLLREAKQSDSPDIDKDGDKSITKTYVDSELEKMRFMISQQADAAAARAVCYAEACIAKAELAAMEAEAAEADAEAAQAFAEAAKMTLKARNSSWIGDRTLI